MTAESAATRGERSDIEPEVHDVALLDDIVLPLEAQLPGLACAGFPLAGEVVGKGDDLGAYEAALEVGMDHARSLGCRGADAHRPGAHFLRAGGEEGLQAEQAIRRTDHPVQPRLL